MPILHSYLPTVAGLIAFILGMLGLFAGTQRDFLTGCELLTLSTPKIGNVPGIHGFYTIYPMSYCEGYFWPDGQGKNITGCFNRTMPFSFDPVRILEGENQSGMSLSSLGWPDAVTGDFRAFALTNRTMIVLYCVGVAAAGAGVLARLGLAIARARQQSSVEWLLFLAGFTSLGIASIIVSAMSFEFVDLVNYHGKESGVTAKYGRKFLGLAWSATTLLLTGSILSFMFATMGPGVSGAGAHSAPKEDAEEP